MKVYLSFFRYYKSSLCRGRKHKDKRTEILTSSPPGTAQAEPWPRPFLGTPFSPAEPQMRWESERLFLCIVHLFLTAASPNWSVWNLGNPNDDASWVLGVLRMLTRLPTHGSAGGPVTPPFIDPEPSPGG